MSNVIYEKPSEQQTYTIYSKSGCPYCNKAKKLVEKENPHVIDCDEYLIEDKEGFLAFINKMSGNAITENEKACREIKTFPIIFYKDQFIGGYSELEIFYKKKCAFDSSLFF